MWAFNGRPAGWLAGWLAGWAIHAHLVAAPQALQAWPSARAAALAQNIYPAWPGLAPETRDHSHSRQGGPLASSQGTGTAGAPAIWAALHHTTCCKHTRKRCASFAKEEFAKKLFHYYADIQAFMALQPCLSRAKHRPLLPSTPPLRLPHRPLLFQHSLLCPKVLLQFLAILRVSKRLQPHPRMMTGQSRLAAGWHSSFSKSTRQHQVQQVERLACTATKGRALNTTSPAMSPIPAETLSLMPRAEIGMRQARLQKACMPKERQ
jgi:hypothetical protein